MYVCQAPGCGRPILLFFFIDRGRWGIQDPVLAAQLPRATAQEMVGLPEPITRDRAEAWSCFHGGDVRAAMLMARAAVQRGVRHLVARRGNLKHELAGLLAEQKITQDLHDFATEVRLAGNDVAHPEELGDVSEAEALESLTFMDEFLRVAIALPERTKARRAQRSAEEPGKDESPAE
jgi:Domain of unknown function (DUF4145)